MNTTKETRRESYRETGKNKKARQNAVLSILETGGELTAREVAQAMHQLGITPTSERNHAAPRLTELLEEGKVEVVGKKKCQHTGRMVSVWRLSKNTE